MARIETKEVKVEVKPTSERQVRWEKFVEGYKKKNPVKFASKNANGEFKTIPATFL